MSTKDEERRSPEVCRVGFSPPVAVINRPPAEETGKGAAEAPQ